MSDGFKDYIPEGENAGAFSAGTGYQDFAPDPSIDEVVAVNQIQVVEEAPTDTFKCDQCEFTTTVKLALAGHKRSHK
jgi:hypothetical protein